MRVKGGQLQRRKHKKVLALAKGYRGARSTLFRKAQEAVWHAGAYAFAGRKDRKSQFRRLWIIRINAALQPFNLRYSQFINEMKHKNIILDRRILADLALKHAPAFEEVLKTVTS